MRRAVIVVIAVVGLAVLASATIVGLNLYSTISAKAGHPASPSSTAESQEQRHMYRLAIASWPYPLPDGVALPRSTPSGVSGQASSFNFVSTFFRCSWQQDYIKGDNRNLALSYLTLWSRAPRADADRVWRNDVIVPAVGGDAGALERLFESHDCDQYRETNVPASQGIAIDRPQTGPLTPEEMINACYGVSGVPCDPNFGPDAVIDTGPASGASGSTQLNSGGIPISYLVAPGDTFLQVSERFGLDIWNVNCARRTDTRLYAGDVLNLSVYAVANVGSENGRTSPKDEATKEACLAQSALPKQ